MSKKFIWHHYVNYEEVSKNEFLKRLGQHYLVCDTNYENPLLNVCFVDEKATQRRYDSIKRRRSTLIFIDDDTHTSETFSISSEEKERKKNL